MKKVYSLFLALSAFAWNPASATTVIPPTFDQLVDRAEIIFQGTVQDVRSQWIGEGAQRHISTYVTFAVQNTLKGEPGATFVLQMLGGTVGDTTMEVTDSPKFARGDREILFVENNGRQFVPLVGIMHGRFHIQRDVRSGKESLTNDHGEIVTSVAKLGHDEAAPAMADASSEAPLSLPDFEAAVRGKLVSATK
ncbi:MAG: hypothetical protein ABI992_02865 [Chthoniobacterales bacterium]